MITINSNPSAMMAQNNLYTNQANLQGNMLQLSTGLRINSAADDAAGLQISNRMETQMNGLEQAQRNANDAISMAQTAEGAMEEMTSILNRGRDLVMQAGNSNYNGDDREAIQKELSALGEELGDIVERTDFAGVNLLDGSGGDGNGKFTFQVGAKAGETISFDIASMEDVVTDFQAIDVKDAPTGEDGFKEHLETIDTQLKTVDGVRADLGAVQNRLESKINNLTNIEENMAVSQSRILDADFAKQTVEMTSNQMLMQAGTSVLAQAKTMPQYATMLL